MENKSLKTNDPRIDETILESLEIYFNRLGEQKPHAVLEMVKNAAEKPTIEFVLKKTKYNLTLSSKILGVTRATLRKKLAKHQIFNKKKLRKF